MSRIIVKNLPKKINAEKLQGIFSAKGSFTDLQLKFTKEGVFRQFAFIGFSTEQESQQAVKYFNNTYIDSSRITVDICADLGDVSKPRAWSKYAEDSSVFQKCHQKDIEKNARKGKEKSDSAKDVTKKQKPKVLEELETDVGFAEFLDLHKKSDGKLIWSNDFSVPTPQNLETKASKTQKKRKSKDIIDTNDETNIQTNASSSSLNTQKDDHSDYESGQSSSDEDSEDSVGSDCEDKNVKPQHSSFTVKENADDFVLKLNGLPYKCNKRKLKDFFKPLKCVSLRIPPKMKGFAYVQFKTEKDTKQALNKHQSILDGKKVLVTRYVRKSQQQLESKGKWKKVAVDRKVQEESVGDSGRLFIRNLSYTCKEEDIEALFKKYGPTTEVHLPIDKFTRKVKGFAYVAFMFPEHAVKALTDLDGTVFQGRLLHILPAEPKKEKEAIHSDNSSYKDKKSANLKASSSSSHNWNTLFLGANAVADVMAEKYNTTKADLLNTQKGSSIAVRMALGETQIVEETREFLTSRGVRLDAFNQPAGERSKTVILVKNLPKGTSERELRELFGKHGEINGVILPPSGITALVEFQEPTEARTAFTRLAYSKFYQVPLYLEWAPGNAIGSKPPAKPPVVKQVKENKEDGKESSAPVEDISEGEEEPEPESTVFVKNLNFETTEESLKNHFEKCGKIQSVIISKKKDLKKPGHFLSMGYGFVHYIKIKHAKRALKELQHSDLDGYSLELKISHKETVQAGVAGKKKTKVTEQKSTKIMVRNIPFEANKREVQELFSVFGELRALRLPQKVAGTGKHRGFGFVDFMTKNDATRAMKALGQSTHLYGRRLVLEWAETDDTDIDTLRKKTADHFFTTSGPERKRVKKSDFVEHLTSRRTADDDD